MICQTYNSSYTHYDFVNIIDQYEGDIKHIKQNLERKEVNLINLLNGINSLIIKFFNFAYFAFRNCLYFWKKKNYKIIQKQI